jgi:hypothetical protein
MFSVSAVALSPNHVDMVNQVQEYGLCLALAHSSAVCLGELNTAVAVL